jgi:plasmid stabilization system protein ParE
MAKVLWSKTAKETLLDCYDFIAEDSNSRAQKWSDKVIESTKNLEVFPEIGVLDSPLGLKNIRKLVLGDYILRYEFDGEDVLILSIKHASTFK